MHGGMHRLGRYVIQGFMCRLNVVLCIVLCTDWVDV